MHKVHVAGEWYHYTVSEKSEVGKCLKQRKFQICLHCLSAYQQSSQFLYKYRNGPNVWPLNVLTNHPTILHHFNMHKPHSMVLTYELIVI